jgi:glutamyl-tRNA reductase
MLIRGDDPKTVLEALSHGLTNKLLHAPTEALNQSGESDPSLKALVARLYHLRTRD